MTVATDNPLLSLGFEIPFDRIRSEHVEPAVRALLEDARARLEALVATPGPRTYENTLGALEGVTERLDRAMNVVSHLESTATTPELRAAYNAVQPEVSEFLSGIALNEGVYGALKAYAAAPEAAALTGPRRRFFTKTLDDFRRSGAELEPAGKKRLSEIDVELATLTLRFSQNVLDATNAFEFVVEDPARLAGLPPSAVEAARQSAEDKGVKGYRFTLQAPSYIPVLTYLDDASVRERFYRAFNTRATEGDHDNRPIIGRVLELRREKAKLLGYGSFADLVLEDRMAKTGAEARRFVATLRARTEPVFEREKEELAAFRRELEGPGAPPIAPWDVSYYAEKLRRARYDFDDEALRPYFPLDRVVSGLFEIAHRLYGVRIEPWQDAPTWHRSVRAYRLIEADGAQSAAFYLDFAPREQKRDGAWMHGLVTGVPQSGSGDDARHLEVLAGSFTPPVGGRPALLNHREVETLFHEFGHMMHHASSRVPIRSLAGTNVAWDFVELPSQIMENWCWEREALDLFARHHETGAPIPDALLQRMRAARTFRAGAATMRQLGFAEIDLALHIDWTPERGDAVEFAREVMSRYSPVPLPEGYAMLAGFSHLFSSPVGYAAGYYSYKWAEVLDADAFSRFQQEGLFSRQVGDAFRSQILALGDTQDPMDLYKSFRGREPTLDALLQRSGLA
ncbi:peptidase M3 [Sorangium cellulosum]|uniref:oligopeptidase A n=1 Tax=Sorangium cellulosum TaxID=56 RepID=A0A2L0F5A5_SORCE|nr:M3 family metallopeptidase [Sorangium cellulosum]AUX46778.1 peptidase M3 [Sorangium cellulosum]